MKHFPALAVSLLPTLFAAASLHALDKATITADRESQTYRCGEKAVFSVYGEENGKPLAEGKYAIEITFCGRDELKSVPVDFAAANPAKVEYSLDKPGFLLLRLCDEKGNKLNVNKRPVLAGAAFEPEKIRKYFPVPKDFTAFWEAGRKKLEKTPVKLEKVEKGSTPKYTLYYVSVESLDGKTLTGYLTVPVGKGPFPAYITVPGAGSGISEPRGGWAQHGVITLTMNVHHFPTADNPLEQNRRYEEDMKQNGLYCYRGAGDKEKFFYYSTYLGISRAIDYVAAMPEYDKRHMVFAGTSQGGGSALILAALNPHITALSACVPALCDHGGIYAGRAPGWPHLHYRPNLDAYAPYFDAANFASFIKVPALVSCGFIDTTCSPSSIYAAYNELKGEKRMVDMPREGHSVNKEFGAANRAFIEEHLGFSANAKAR